MKTWLVALALLSTAYFAPGCATTPQDVQRVSQSEATQIGTAAADLVLARIAPGLISTTEAAASARAAAEKIVADREAAGKSPTAPLSPREWVEIAGAIGLGLLGLNQTRNAKYVKAGKGEAKG